MIRKHYDPFSPGRFWAIIAAFIIWGEVMYLYSQRHHIAFAGAWGDSFAPLSGLVSALALLAAIHSIRQQRQMIEAQQDEMRQDREQFAKQAQALALSNRVAIAAGLLEVDSRLSDLEKEAMSVAGPGGWRAFLERYEDTWADPDRHRTLAGIGTGGSDIQNNLRMADARRELLDHRERLALLHREAMAEGDAGPQPASEAS